MSKAERIKEELGYLKVIFALLVAIDVSLLAWLAQHFQRAEPLLVMGAVLLAGMISAAIVWVNALIYRRLSRLEKL